MTEPEAPKRHRMSYSKMADYKQCSWAFYLKRIRKLPEQPAIWNPAGDAVHEVTEMFDVAMAGENKRWAPEPFMNSYRDVFDRMIEERVAKTGVPVEQWRASGVGRVKSRPNGEDRNFWYELGPQLVRKYIEWRFANEDDLTIAVIDGEPAIEYEVLTQMLGLDVIGYIDRIFRDTRTGVLLVVDLKSGRSMPRENGQLGQYSVQFEQKTGQPLTWGAFYNGRMGRLERVQDLTTYTVASLGKEFAVTTANIEAGKFEPNITNLCKSCSMRRFCKFQGGIEPEETTDKESS